MLKKGAIAVYCGSSFGQHTAFKAAAISVGRAIAASNRKLVYGGSKKGLMGLVSGAAIDAGGEVIGIIPHTMAKVGGDKEKVKSIVANHIPDKGREAIQTIVVESMHERKIEMATRVDGFIGLPGGFGTFEEVLEVTTWTQLGIHDKPVVLLNVLSFWDPLITLIKNSIDAGFIRAQNENLIIVVNGPRDAKESETFDWGKAALEATDRWESGRFQGLYRWGDLKSPSKL